jgi:G protein beta subunit-like protein
LIAAAGNSHIKLFDVNSNSPQETFHYEGHQGNVTAVGFQKDNRWMYTGGPMLSAVGCGVLGTAGG